MTQSTRGSRRMPPLSRSFVRGFLSGSLVVLIAGLGIALALVLLVPAAVEVDWPVTLKADDCRYSGSSVTAFRVASDQTAGNLAEVYARAWSGSGWDVTTRVAGQYAILTATRSVMTYSLELFQQGQLIQAVGNGQQQCAP